MKDRRYTSIPASARLLASVVILCSLRCSACSQTATSQATMEQAEALLDSKRNAEACKMAADVARDQPNDWRTQQRAAQVLYLGGKPHDSINLFERANELSPSLLAHNWQYGIALATVGDFAKGAAVFKKHHDVNPDDVENSAWYFLCVAKSAGVEKAKEAIIDSRGDPRPPMMSILKLYKGDISAEQLLEEVREIEGSLAQKRAQMYAHLYIALFYDAHSEQTQAREQLERAIDLNLQGYMAQTARVYLEHRWPDAKN